MACSGQIYGLNGSVTLLNDRHRGVFATHDLIRLVPKSNEIRRGYLLIALGHPTLGRPLVIRHAYGTSIPHLEPEDIADIPIPRFGQDIEDAIAGRSEEAARLRAQADDLEDKVTARADLLVDAFLHGEPG
jgi:type I restriction enzyme, S subunit